MRDVVVVVKRATTQARIMKGKVGDGHSRSTVTSTHNLVEVILNFGALAEETLFVLFDLDCDAAAKCPNSGHFVASGP